MRFLQRCLFVPILPRDDAVGDLTERVDNRVDLRSANPHSASIQRRIAPAQHHDSSGHRADLTIVTMGPDPIES